MRALIRKQKCDPSYEQYMKRTAVRRHRSSRRCGLVRAARKQLRRITTATRRAALPLRRFDI